MSDSAKSRTVPPSRFQRTITNELTKSITIVDATLAGITLGPRTTYSGFKGFPGGVSIFAEKVTINSSIGKEAASLAIHDAGLTISCHELDVKSPGQLATLSTRGKDGLDSPADKHGAPGHDIQLYVGNLSRARTEQLQLDTRGGSGGALTGANAKDGGGDGGDAAKISIVFRINMLDLSNEIRAYKTAAALPVEWDEDLELDARCITDKSFEVTLLANLVRDIRLRYQVELREYPQLLSPLDAQLALTISSGQEPRDSSGYPLRSIFTLTKAVNRVIRAIRNFQNETWRAIAQRCLYKGGLGGKAEDVGTARGTVGRDGKVGSFASYSIGYDTDADAKLLTFCFAHPLQCAMVLERAKVYFYLGSEANRNKSQRLLTTLVNRLSFADEAFLESCRENNTTIPLLSSYLRFCGSPEALVSTVIRLKAIRDEATRMVLQLTAITVDYYGLPHDWVPRINYEAFRTAMDSALLELERTEDVYLPYLNAAEQKEKLDQTINAASDRVVAARKAIDKDLKQLKQILSQKYHALVDEGRIQAIKDAQSATEDGLKSLQAKVASASGLDIRSTINHLVKFASSPSKGGAVKTALKLTYEGFTTVPSLAGEPIPKSLLIRKLTDAGRDVGSLKRELLEVSSKPDGGLTIDTEFADKVLVEMAALDEMLNQFADDKFGAEAAAAKKYLKAVADLVIARNTEVVEYNLVLKTILAKQREIAEMEAAVDKMNTDRLDEKNTAENLINMKNLLETIYDNNRARVMRLLSFLQRSLRYKTLTKVDYIDNAFDDTVGSNPGVDDAVLSMSSTVLRALGSRLSDHLFAVQERQGSDQSLFPSNFESGGVGKRYRLSQSALTALLKTKQVQVRIAPVDAVADADHEKGSDFRGCADVRIYRARFWLSGLRLFPGEKMSSFNAVKCEDDDPARRFRESKIATIKLTHTGREAFLDADNVQHQFIHEPINITFSYRLFEDGTWKLADSTSGDIVNFSSMTRGVNSIYAAPSPYTDWMVSLKDFDFDSIDTSGVTEGVFEFFGSYRSFS